MFDHPLHHINQDWFDEHGVVDPVEAYQKWEKWLNEKKSRRYKVDAMLKKALEYAGGRGETTVRNYLHENPKRRKRVGEAAARVFDAIMISMGEDTPPREKGCISGRKWRIALLSELSDLPSVDYHMEIINGVLREARKHKYAVTPHEIYKKDTTSIVRRVIQTYRPDGMIFVRKAPEDTAIRYIKNEEIPVVLINADQDPSYDFPIKGNIVTEAGSRMAAEFEAWISEVHPGALEQPAGEAPNAVIAAMPAVDSHRRQRVNLIKQVLENKGFAVELVQLADYHFRNAYSVWQTHPDAAMYICLSDQIAVALKHILAATNQPSKHRIVGFDDSPLAEKESITSFGQYLQDIGELAVDRLHSSFKDKALPFKEIPVEMYLAVRD